MSIEIEQFESIARASGFHDFDVMGNGCYADDFLQHFYLGWHASRQGLEGEAVAYQYWWPESPRQVTVCKAKDLPSGGPDLIVQPLYTHPASAEVERLRSRVAELVAVAVSVRDDLLLRSEIDSDGTRCVNLSASKWSSFCDVIDETAKAEGADNAG